jgi:hypothetical protein
LEVQKKIFLEKVKLQQGPKEKEIKEWIRIGHQVQGIPGKNFDMSNMAVLINYLNFIGLVNDIEKKQMQDLYENNRP